MYQEPGINEKRKELLAKCEIASKKIDEGNKEAIEVLYQLLKKYNDSFEEEKLELKYNYTN